MLESFNNTFEYKKLSPEEQEKRGILGRLVGVIADSNNPTRNGRQYSKELWENVFNDPIMEEKIKNKVVLGELGHPADRTETDITQAAIALAEKPKFAKDGKLYGVFDILNTPNGKILKTLCDYGTVIGVSSRGEGDIIEDYDGNEAVDPETYSCETWDAVLLPAVKEARMSYVTEALDKKRYNKTLRQKLSEELDSASIEEKEVMQETLEKLDINLDEKLVEPSQDDLKPIEDKFAELGLEIEDKGNTLMGNKHYQLRKELDHKVTKEDLGPIFDALCELSTDDIPTVCNVGVHRDGDNIISASLDVLKKYVEEELNDKEVQEEQKEEKEVVDNQSNALLDELQEALKDKSDLEASIADTQNKLAVSDAKVESLKEELSKYKELSVRLSSKAQESKELSKKISTLEESITAKDTEIKKLKSGRLLESKKSEHKCKQLEESISNSKAEKQKLTEDLNKANNKIETLSKEIEEIKSASILQEKENNEKVAKLNTLVEAYKKVANSTMKRYIESKATMYGISFKDIRDRLPDSYTADDVDKICESLRTYNVNMNRLPINVKPRLRFTESKNDALRVNLNPADEIDDELIELAKLG